MPSTQSRITATNRDISFWIAEQSTRRSRVRKRPATPAAPSRRRGQDLQRRQTSIDRVRAV